MAQHDLTVDNASSRAVRADLNSALQALGSTSSGAGAPGTTFSGQLWFETDTNRFRMRNNANSGWLDIGYIDQADGLEIYDGTKVVNSAGAETARLDTHLQSAWDAGVSSSARLISPTNLKGAIGAQVGDSVSAGRLASAWANIDGATISDDYNISSVTSIGTGTYSVNIDDNMDNSLYAVFGSAFAPSAALRYRYISIGTRSVSAFQVFRQSGLAESGRYFLAVFGDNASL